MAFSPFPPGNRDGFPPPGSRQRIGQGGPRRVRSGLARSRIRIDWLGRDGEDPEGCGSPGDDRRGLHRAPRGLGRPCEDAPPENLRRHPRAAQRLAYYKVANLRYGENTYQKAAVYHEPLPFTATATAEKLQGKELSYNNLIDLDAALRLATEFERPAAVVIKHTNPSGVALASTPAEAYSLARAGDPISAPGGFVGTNHTVDLATALAFE